MSKKTMSGGGKPVGPTTMTGGGKAKGPTTMKGGKAKDSKKRR